MSPQSTNAISVVKVTTEATFTFTLCRHDVQQLSAVLNVATYESGWSEETMSFIKRLRSAVDESGPYVI